MKHYQDLYQSESAVREKSYLFLEKVDLGQLSQEHFVELDASIGLEEIKEVIGSLHCSSFPGPDGLTPLFYKHFGHVLAEHLYDLFGACLADGEIPPIWRLAKIIFLPKQDEDLSLPESYHPISLLNTDYKILTSVLMARC